MVRRIIKNREWVFLVLVKILVYVLALRIAKLLAFDHVIRELLCKIRRAQLARLHLISPILESTRVDFRRIITKACPTVDAIRSRGDFLGRLRRSCFIKRRQKLFWRYPATSQFPCPVVVSGLINRCVIRTKPRATKLGILLLNQSLRISQRHVQRRWGAWQRVDSRWQRPFRIIARRCLRCRLRSDI